ncbi:MAG: hypothetical protein PWQ60_2533 [Thermoanaerobacteraceae bacterium]|nr:hypothetical protein [Thermoanaerobacteraceae bacterium]
MEEVKNDFKKILLESVAIAFLSISISIIFDKSRIALGLSLGAFVSSINFILLYISVIKSLGNGYIKAFAFMYGTYFVRFTVILIALLICLNLGLDIFISSIAGLMVIKLVIYSNTIFGRWKRWNSFQR